MTEEAVAAPQATAEGTPTQGQTPTAAAPKVEAPQTPRVPVEYKIDLPDSSPVKPHLAKLGETFNTLGLPQEAAQVLAKSQHDLYAEIMSAQEKATTEALAKQEADWKSSALMDPYLGEGADKKLAESCEMAKRGLLWIDPTGALGKTLDEIGLGYNPVVLKAFKKLGISLADEKLVQGTPTFKKAPETDAERLAATPGYEALRP